MTALDSDLTPLETIGSAADPVIADIQASTGYSVGAVVQGSAGTYDGITATPLWRGYLVCVSSGTTGTTATPYLLGEAPEQGQQVKPGIGGTAVFRVVSQDEAYALAAGDAGDINSTAATLSDPGIAHDPATFAKKYRAKMDEVRALAGIVPKSDAGIDGGACWREQNNDHYWQVNGGEYLPVYSNIYWHSCIRQYDQAKGKDVVVSTYEVGFGLRIGCENRLEEGDQVTITIGDVTADYPYQVGDKYEIPLVSGGPIDFAGGVTGTDTLTWAVKSSTAGLLDDYALDADEEPYSDGGLGFTINRGALDFALGDAFTFGVETGGQFRWRKDSGSWSADTAIADTVALAEGLTAAFASGASPSFVATDLYRFSVRQPNSPNHAKIAHGDAWRWSGSTATLTLAWGNDQTIEVVGLLRHGLSAPATVSIALKNSGGTTLQTLTPAVMAGPLVIVLDTPLTTVRSIVVTVASATGLSLGWIYAGQPLSTKRNAAVTLRRAYALDRGDGINPRGTYLGAGRGVEMRWENSWLIQDEFDALLALVDACKVDSDAPVVLLPNVADPSIAALVRIDSDALEVSDAFDFQPTDSGRRRLSLTLPLAAVLA